MPQAIVVVDAFADRPFSGNPAAVCLTDGPANEGWMWQVAREMNLSETAFLHRLDEPDTFRLRWLTPTVEVDLCGHATLAASHALWESGQVLKDREIHFETRSGRLSSRGVADEIELDFPELKLADAAIPEGLEAAIGARVLACSTTGMDLLAELEGEAAVRGLAPKMSEVARLPVRGLIVTSRSSGEPYHFVSRFFAPQSGVDEDPVTGSAHCALAPYWGERFGHTNMVGFQASERGGTVKVRREDGRVKLTGRAVTVLRGEIWSHKD